jgi:protein-S-isoprenylcysteine O-methyltransferase Ste14
MLPAPPTIVWNSYFSKNTAILTMELFITARIILFIASTVLLIIISWRSLREIKSHGFFRFFAFEAVLILALLNIPFWFKHSFSPFQLISWILLSFSVLYIFQGVYYLRKYGGNSRIETRDANFAFEDTENLVTVGIYHYVRHPMYGSLLLLTWGIFFKHINAITLLVSLAATVFLVMTAKKEELEDISFFGNSYKEYIKKTKMFIPYLF